MTLLDWIQITASVVTLAIMTWYLVWVFRFKRATRAHEVSTKTACEVIEQVTDLNEFISVMASLGYRRKQALDLAVTCAQFGITREDIESITNGRPE